MSRFKGKHINEQLCYWYAQGMYMFGLISLNSSDLEREQELEQNYVHILEFI